MLVTVNTFSLTPKINPAVVVLQHQADGDLECRLSGKVAPHGISNE
jgi:hypothetical protein